jgi:hypothetical protein
MTNRPYLLLALAACKLQFSGHTGHTTTTPVAEQNAQFQPNGNRPNRQKPAPAFDDAKYKACLAAFDANYDAWLPVDRAAKAVLAKVKDKSPYVAAPALLAELDKVDTKAAVRQTRTLPPGAIYAPATRLELATALVDMAVRTHAKSCVDNQFRVEVDNEYLPPLTGDKERDKVILCGGPDGDERTAWTDARRTAADAFNKANTTLHDDHTGAGAWSQVASYAASAKETTLGLTTMSGNRRCVKNGRYGHQADGSWGPLCDWEELPAYSVGSAKSYHLAPQELPFQVKKGDQVVLSYELDPDAPASQTEVARKGGWWYLTAVTRGQKTIYEACGTTAAHDAELQSTLRPLLVMSRKSD